ncbi:MAG: amidohydrolase family protein, partial [Pseudomonadota bacterium]
KGRYGINDFVRFTSTDPARIYGLAPKKGTIAIGSDADIAIWDPDKKVTLSDDVVHDLTGYTPFAGRELRGWPTTVLRRGDVIVSDGNCSAEPGSGQYLPREGGEACEPTGRLAPEFDLATNFGANLY